MTLAPRHTTVINLKQLFDQVPGTPQQGGLRIRYRGAVNGLVADGGLEDADIGFGLPESRQGRAEPDTSTLPAASISLGA